MPERTRTRSTICLVGGPPKLDGSRHDLAASAHDRADADGNQFVRVVRGASGRGPVGSLAALQERCTDRASAEALALEWRAAVFTYRRDRRLRTRYYRYTATHRLEAARDGRGRWHLVLAEPASTATDPGRPIGRTSADGPTAAADGIWSALEAAIDAAATRFGAVADLLPDGPLAERAQSVRHAVGACVGDGARLCAVGRLTADGWEPADDRSRAAALASQVVALVSTIDEATTHLVDLHLAVGDHHAPAEPVVGLAMALAEVPR